MSCWAISSSHCIFVPVEFMSSQQRQPHAFCCVRCAQTVAVAFCHLQTSGVLLVCKLWDIPIHWLFFPMLALVFWCPHPPYISTFLSLLTFHPYLFILLYPPFQLKLLLLICYWPCHLPWFLQYKTSLWSFDLLLHYSKLAREWLVVMREGCKI